jgi:prepilin-type N-terminal cleavage/methylation domain-containing protein
MMKLNSLKQKGFTLIEFIVAFAIAAILLTAVVTFSNSSISINRGLNNEANAINQMKNAFNYISRDSQMAGMVNTTSPGVFPLTLGWITYPTNLTRVVYTIGLDGTLTRTEYANQDTTPVSTMVIANNVSIDVTKTNSVWDNTNNKLTINMDIVIGKTSVIRQFILTPRVIQSSSQTANTITGSSPSPSNYGNPLTLTATFSPSSITSGTVTFLDGGTSIGVAPVQNGTATFQVSNLSVGSHILTAVFSGDALYSSNTSPAWTQVVNQGTTSVNLTSSPNPSSFSQSVTFTAAVISVPPAVATGTVTFKDGGTTLGTGTVASGSAAFIVSSLSVASHTITAVYSGDANFNTSTSSSLTQIVNKAGTTVNLISSQNPSSSGQSITFTASVTPTGATGTVTFKDGGTTLGTGTVASGSATFIISSLSAGSHTVTAVYSGDTNYNTSTSSPALTQIVVGPVNAAKSTLLPLTSSIVANGISTQVLIVQAKDANGNNLFSGGLPTVTITLLSGNGTIGPVQDNGNGTYSATVTSSTLAGTSGAFGAAIAGSSVMNGGGSQTQATVNYVTGNTIDVTTSENWGDITTGTGPGGQPSSADTINIHAGVTLTVNSTGTNSPITNGQAYIINVNTTQVGTGTLTFQANNNGIKVGTLNIAGGGNGASAQKGVVTMPAGGFLTVTNAISLSGSNWTFTQGSGTNAAVIYGGSGNQTILSALTYVNLQTLGSGTKTFDAADTVPNLTIGGATTVMLGGNLVISGALSIGTGCTLDVNSSNNYSLTVNGGWTNSGTFNQQSGTVTLNGTTAQTMTGATTFYKLTLNNSTGLTITANETVSNSLTLTSGKITTGSNMVILSYASGTITSASNTKYIIGNLQKKVAAGSSVSVTFEVGTTGGYEPVTVVFTTVNAAGSLAVGSTSGKHSPWPSAAQMSQTHYVNLYWTMTNSGIVFNNYNVTFTYVNPGDFISGFTTTTCIVMQYNNPNFTVPAGTYTRTTTTVKLTGFTLLSGDFVIGNPSGF